MKRKALLPLILFALVVRSAAFSEDGRKTVDELVTTLQEEMKDLEAGGDPDHAAASLKQYIRQIQANLAEENERSLEQALDNFGNYEPSKKALDGIAAVRKSIKSERQRKTLEVIAEIQGLLETTRDKLTRAEDPEELDKVIASLSRNRFNNMSDNQGYDANDATLRALVSEISSARQFVTSWQDYLQASNSGNLSQASQTLRNLSSQESTLIPRSQIISRLDFAKSNGETMDSIIQGIKSLDDLKPAIQKLSIIQGSARSSGSENMESRETLQSLIRLEKSYREFRAGLPVNVEVICLTPTNAELAGKLDIIELRAALLLLVLPRCLDLPEAFKPTQGETVDQLLDRATEDATSREDLAACRRIQSVRQTIAQASGVTLRDVDNLSDYEAGRKQFAAGQYMLAVVSLQNALKGGSDMIPAAKTGEILALIEKEHPKEYEQGMMEFLTPRPAQDYDYARMPYRNYMSYRNRYMEGDPRGQTGTTLVLPVPAREAPAEKTDVKPTATDGPAPSEPKPAEKLDPAKKLPSE